MGGCKGVSSGAFLLLSVGQVEETFWREKIR